MKPIHNKACGVARFLEVIIGLYFIAGAIPKILDIDKFVLQVAAYKVIEAPVLLEWAALFTVFTEICLGMFLLLRVRMKGLTIIALQGMILVFTGLITYAWFAHGLEDCGCFPIFKMSPPVSLFKNGLILAASVYILWIFQIKGRRVQANADEAGSPEKIPECSGISGMSPVRTLTKVAVSMLVAAGCMAYSGKNMDREALEQDMESAAGPFSQFELFTNEGYFNLAEGVYLVAVMSTSCPECKANVPALNDLYMVPDIPPLVALCYEETPGELEVFKSMTNAVFPTYSLGDRVLLYFRLLENESFRLVLVQNGQAAASWDGYVPELEELQEKINQLYAGK